MNHMKEHKQWVVECLSAPVNSAGCYGAGRYLLKRNGTSDMEVRTVGDDNCRIVSASQTLPDNIASALNEREAMQAKMGDK